jgi:hypothetical protein
MLSETIPVWTSMIQAGGRNFTWRPIDYRSGGPADNGLALTEREMRLCGKPSYKKSRIFFAQPA